MGWDGMDGMVIIGQWSSKSTFDINNKKLDRALPEGISEKLHRSRVRSRDKHGATGNDIPYI